MLCSRPEFTNTAKGTYQASSSFTNAQGENKHRDVVSLWKRSVFPAKFINFLKKVYPALLLRSRVAYKVHVVLSYVGTVNIYKGPYSMILSSAVLSSSWTKKHTVWTLHSFHAEDVQTEHSGAYFWASMHMIVLLVYVYTLLNIHLDQLGNKLNPEIAGSKQKQSSRFPLMKKNWVM